MKWSVTSTTTEATKAKRVTILNTRIEEGIALEAIDDTNYQY